MTAVEEASQIRELALQLEAEARADFLLAKLLRERLKRRRPVHGRN